MRNARWWLIRIVLLGVVIAGLNYAPRLSPDWNKRQLREEVMRYYREVEPRVADKAYHVVTDKDWLNDTDFRQKFIALKAGQRNATGWEFFHKVCSDLDTEANQRLQRRGIWRNDPNRARLLEQELEPVRVINELGRAKGQMYNIWLRLHWWAVLGNEYSDEQCRKDRVAFDELKAHMERLLKAD